MIYQAIVEAADRGELILVAGGFCRYHRRRDGTVVVREILVLPEARRFGIGRAMLREVAGKSPGCRLIARSPSDNYVAWDFYFALGWSVVATEKSRKGTVLNTYEAPACG